MANKIRITRRKEKKALSEIIGYVLLLVLAVSLSTIVYSYLKDAVKEPKDLGCPDGTQVIITDVAWPQETGGDLYINLSNRGRFSVDGVFVRINNIPNEAIGRYTVKKFDKVMPPGYKPAFNDISPTIKILFNSLQYDIDGKRITPYDRFYFVEIQPYIMDDKVNQIKYCAETSSKVYVDTTP